MQAAGSEVSEPLRGVAITLGLPFSSVFSERSGDAVFLRHQMPFAPSPFSPHLPIQQGELCPFANKPEH